MGRLHARVYARMAQAKSGIKLVGVYDATQEAAAAVADEFDTPHIKTLDEVFERAKAVSIAVPTQAHRAVALAAIERGVACLIEKPLAKTVQECQDICMAAERTGTVVQVGHIERFNPAVLAMSRLNISPQFIEVTRISPLSFRSIDVGVVLDMMIHDIDIVLNLAKSEVVKVDAVGVGVIGAGGTGTGGAGDVAEDVCNARLTFANGCVANLTASRLALKTERRLRIFSADAYVSLDYQKKYGIVARRGGNLQAIREAVERIRAGEIDDLSQLNYQELVQVEELKIDDVEPLRAELESFVAAAQGKAGIMVTAEQGLAAVELAGRIVAAMPKMQV
jgi:predicted dehydrogenase